MVRRNNQLRHTPRFSAKAGQTQKYRQSRSAPNETQVTRVTHAHGLQSGGVWRSSAFAKPQPAKFSGFLQNATRSAVSFSPRGEEPRYLPRRVRARHRTLLRAVRSHHSEEP